MKNFKIGDYILIRDNRKLARIAKIFVKSRRVPFSYIVVTLENNQADFFNDEDFIKLSEEEITFELLKI